MKISSSFILLIMKFPEFINCPFELPFRAVDFSSYSLL
jgi:hypothetical protein